jgi:hypothetical protein
MREYTNLTRRSDGFAVCCSGYEKSEAISGNRKSFELVSSSTEYAFSKRLTLKWDVKRKASEQRAAESAGYSATSPCVFESVMSLLTNLGLRNGRMTMKPSCRYL